MVNYRRVLCEVALLFTVAILHAGAAPAHDCKDDRVFDQRQNGSENYRLNIDGVVIAIAPAESLLSAVSDIDISDFLSELDNYSDDEHKPKPPTVVTDILIGEQPKPDEKPVLSKPDNKPSEAEPEEKPQDSKPESLEAPLNIPEKQQEKGHKKSAQLRKQENAQRLKHRLASIFLPFLRKRRHQ